MRRFAIIVGSIGIAALAAVLTLPWWLGAALHAIGPRLGATFAEYEQIGYTRFRLEQVEYQRRGVRVTAEFVETDTPTLWAWRWITGNPSEVTAGRWTTDVQPRSDAVTESKPRGWVPLRQQLLKVADRLDRWLPRAQVGAGVVTWKNGGLEIASAAWRERGLTSPEVRYKDFGAAVEIALPKEGEMRAELKAPAHGASAWLSSEGARIEGEATWWDQVARMQAMFPEEGWLAMEAEALAENWDLEGSRVGIGAQYARLRGNVRVVWREEALRADVSAEGVPAQDSEAPPLKVDVRGYGEAGMFVAEAVEISLPGVTANLSEPLRIDRRGQVQSAPSRFSFAGDLAQLPWIQARGEVKGEGSIRAGESGVAAIDFWASGEQTGIAETEAERIRVEGRLEWPNLEITDGRIESAGERELAVSGGLNLRTREMFDVTVRGEISHRAVARWVPEKIGFEAVALEATAAGPWRTVNHEGRAKVEALTLARLKPMAVEIEWSGQAENIATFETVVTSGESRLTAKGAANVQEVTLREVEFAQRDEMVLRLTQPGVIRWRPQLTVEALRFEGSRGGLAASLRWGESGEVDLSVRGAKPGWFRDVFDLPAVEWTAESFELRGRWAEGPATFGAKGNFAIDLGAGRAARVAMELNGSGEGLAVTSLNVSEGAAPIVTATGRLPIVVRPADEPMMEIDGDGRLVVEARTSANPEFWAALTQLSGVEIFAPEAVVNLHGTWAEPLGEAALRADRIAPVPGRFAGQWPRIEAIEARVIGDSNGIKLEPLSFLVNGQAVRVVGALPISGRNWQELREHPRRLLNGGDLRIEIPDAELAALAQHFPAFLAPKGRLQLDLTVKPDASLSGYLRIRDATSRPLGPLGVLQDVNAEVRFDGRAAELRSVTARMGGQVVTLQGRAELPETGRPRLNFTLKGENLPFVRRTGLLLRGDLDLTLMTSPGGRTTIGGRVGLRDSLFLADVRALIPSGAKGGPARVPYFSIEEEPLSAWRLDVLVEGDEFLRLRTPVFNGTASARVQLDGTLGEPRARGEATIERGNVRLPFANFEVRQGQVRVTPDLPEPQLLITGTTRRYGYDLRMELTGPASSPQLTFSSSPPLEAEQVLLLVMAGQAPNDEITTTDRQRVARFGAFFGQSLLGTLGGDAGGADRLTISSGENISDQGRETYNIEYRLSNRWALTGEYDEFDDYYGGLKWRIYTKGGRDDEEEE